MRFQLLLSVFLFVSSLLVSPVMAGNTFQTDEEIRLLSEQGDAEAQVNLGLMYKKGQGIPQDYKEAYVWFNLGAAQGQEEAKKDRDIMAKKLDPARCLISKSKYWLSGAFGQRCGEFSKV